MSHWSTDDFLHVLADCIQDDVLQEVQDSPVAGLPCDESTDAANLKQLMIFVRLLVKGSPHTRFLKVVELQNGKADTIKEKLVDVCQESGLPLSKITGFGSDGASVMVGCRTGVANRLTSLNPEMISVHCGAHRLALAASQAASSVPYMKKFNGYLNTLFYFFKNSLLREAGLHAIQDIMEEPVLKLKRAVDTRWLSHDQAVTAIRHTLPSLLTCLEREAAGEEDGDAVAHGLLSGLGTYNFIATVYLMSDVLPLLTTLSLVFQTENVDLSIVQPQVAATISSLKLLRKSQGLQWKTFLVS